MMIIKV